MIYGAMDDLNETLHSMMYVTYLYVREYAKMHDPRKQLGVGFGHAANILEAISIREGFQKSLKKQFADLEGSEISAPEIRAHILQVFDQKGAFPQPLYDRSEVTSLVDEALCIAGGSGLSAKLVTERFAEHAEAQEPRVTRRYYGTLDTYTYCG